jgi:hypothetical protein
MEERRVYDGVEPVLESVELCRIRNEEIHRDPYIASVLLGALDRGG